MERDKNQANSFTDIAAITYITAENAVFTKKSDFLSLTLTIPDAAGKPERKEFPRVFFHRAFPFDAPDAYLSVLNEKNEEIGMIAHLDDLLPEDRDSVRLELERKYYTPVIRAILSVKDQFGFSYWKVDTDAGEMTFTLRDTFHSILRVENSNRLFITDIDGCRFEIPDVEALDRKSYQKMELFL